MACVDVPSAPNDDPFKPSPYIKIVILTSSLPYDNFDYLLLLCEKKLRRSMETKMNADPWGNPRFQLWSVSSKPPKNTPLLEYGKANRKRFTIRVVHGGFFTDYPGKVYE
ncbi:unnamed protein product [Lactuca virosa]|uniref:Uncharacterized protein n=1 Tax=Lactuca virosa TaxID=75947 RepID=A0AAU9NA02_9ASTR|nr:unnamed protein product [Lactuca virosa]